MKIKIEGDELVVRAPLTLVKASRSGNSTIIATSRGQQYIGQYNGRPTYLQLNVMQMEGAGGNEVVEVERGSERGTTPATAKRAA